MNDRIGRIRKALEQDALAERAQRTKEDLQATQRIYRQIVEQAYEVAAEAAGAGPEITVTIKEHRPPRPAVTVVPSSPQGVPQSRLRVSEDCPQPRGPKSPGILTMSPGSPQGSRATISGHESRRGENGPT